MCQQCDGISERFNLYAWSALRPMSLYDVANGKGEWSVITFQLACTRCDGRFRLLADGYHGRSEWSGRFFEEAAAGAEDSLSG
jgi:hypothetical protein